MDPWYNAIRQLKEELNSPLPGGRGFQKQRDRKIQRLCKEIAELQLPTR